MAPRHFAILGMVLVGLAACASVKVQDRKTLIDGKQPRPTHIFVRDFVASPDVPTETSSAGQAAAASSPQTPEQIALAREVGAELAKVLASEIAAMGLPVVYAGSPPTLAVYDLEIRCKLLSVVEGSEVERVAIGMGKGAAERKVAVEGYQMTEQGLRELGSGTLDTAAGEAPGAATSLAVTAVTKNPLGLIVSTGMKLHEEQTGAVTIHGKAKDIAKQIATELRPRFESQGWISPSQNTP